MPRKVKSKAQARFLGAIAGGRRKPPKGLTRAKARELLRGTKVKRLPPRKRRKR